MMQDNSSPVVINQDDLDPQQPRKKRAPRFKGDTSKQRFSEQKMNARRRGIHWLLTYEEWLAVWEVSGKWQERGRRRGQYCLSRCRDQGAYEIGNVFIQLKEANDRERKVNGKSRGRGKGVPPPNVKLTEDKVCEILDALSRGVKGRDLAKLHQVTESTISAIKHGQNWKGVVIHDRA